MRKSDSLLQPSGNVKNGGGVLHSPMQLHGVVLNELRTGTSFTFYLIIIACFTQLSLKEVSEKHPNTQRCSAASLSTDLNWPDHHYKMFM
jgi:hypothetical protein